MFLCLLRDALLCLSLKASTSQWPCRLISSSNPSLQCLQGVKGPVHVFGLPPLVLIKIDNPADTLEEREYFGTSTNFEVGRPQCGTITGAFESHAWDLRLVSVSPTTGFELVADVLQSEGGTCTQKKCTQSRDASAATQASRSWLHR